MSQWKRFFKKAGFKQKKASVTKIWTDAFRNCYEYLRWYLKHRQSASENGLGYLIPQPDFSHSTFPGLSITILLEILLLKINSSGAKAPFCIPSLTFEVSTLIE